MLILYNRKWHPINTISKKHILQNNNNDDNSVFILQWVGYEIIFGQSFLFYELF